MRKQNNTPNNNYGQVYLPILTNTDLNVTDRVVYSLLSVRQGGSDEAHLTQTQIADSLDKSSSAIKSAFKKLKAAGIIEAADTGWKVKQPKTKNLYGNVEQIVLGTPLISNHAKLLYTYYVVVTAGVDKCTRSAETITKDLEIAETSYRKAFKELTDNMLITVGKRKTSNGYVNAVAPRRLAKANPKDFLPASWFKEEDVVLDTPDVNFYKVAAKINAKAKVANQMDDGINSGGPKVSLQGVRGLQTNGTNNNHNTNHNINRNSQPDLTASTSLPLPSEDKRSASLKDFTPNLNPRVFAPDFNIDELRDREVSERECNTIITAFTGIREVLDKYEWRLTNEDYDRFDEIFRETGYREGVANEYVEFIELYTNQKPERLSYYNSFEIMHRYFHHKAAGLVGTTDKNKTREIRDIMTI